MECCFCGRRLGDIHRVFCRGGSAAGAKCNRRRPGAISVRCDSIWPDGIRLRRYECIDSTNEEAKRLAVAGERGPLWLIAAEQTKGRGRHGRIWVSRFGNLFSTLIMEAAPQHSWEIGFVAGLGTLDAANRYVAPDIAKLKWPNDV